MTVPAKYTLTEAHFRIAELESERDRAQQRFKLWFARHKKLLARLRQVEAERDEARRDWEQYVHEVEDLQHQLELKQKTLDACREAFQRESRRVRAADEVARSCL
jgi:chromosome segregation ATPase